MSTLVGSALAGLGGGAVLAMLGTGLVLTHRSSGVLNFAHGAIALYLGSAFFELRESGDLVLPLIGLPHRVTVVDRPTVLAAFVTIAATAAVLGAVVYLVLARPLRNAAAVTQVAGTLGLFLYLSEVVRLRFPPSSAGATVRRPVLPGGSVDVLGATVGINRVQLAVFAVVVGTATALLYSRTRFGLVSRAAADDEHGARLLGRSPAVYGAAAWALAAVLAGGAAVLAEPVIGLSPMTPLLVVPALAAALPGRMRSTPLAVAGGIAIGVVQSLVLGLAISAGDRLPGWLPVTGVQEAVPTAVILWLLVRRSAGFAGQTAGSRAESRAPAAGAAAAVRAPRNPVLWATLLAGGATAALLTWSASYRHALIVSMLFALVCLSVVVVTGWSGQVSLLPLSVAGVAGFVALGAATAGAPFPVAGMLGVIASAVVARLLHAPLSRLRGVSFAVATLALAISIERLVLDGAATALAGSDVPRPTLLGIDVGIGDAGARNFRPEFGIVTLVALVAAGLAVVALRRSQAGLRVLATADDEVAAAAAGIDTDAVRRQAFMFSCTIAGIAGVLMAYSVTAVSAQSFMVLGSVVAVSITALTGLARIMGALVAGALAPSGLFTTLTEGWSVSTTGGGTYAVLGLMLMASAVLAPAGLIGWSAPRGPRSPADPPPAPVAEPRVPFAPGELP